MARIGIITILYKCDSVLEGFFKSLSKQTYKDYHLYIVDNAPSFNTDIKLSHLTAQYPISSFSHIKSDKNVGFAKGNNIAISLAKRDGCEFLLIINNDIEFYQVYLLGSMIEIADKKGESLIVPKIYVYDTKKIWMAGGHFKWWKAMGTHVGEWQDNKSEYDTEKYFDYAPLCIMLIRLTVIDSVGILDERFFVYYEDADFAYRAKAKGFKILYCPQFNILHKVGSSTGGYNSLFSVYYGNRNRIFFIRKHFGFLKRLIAYSFVLSTRIIKYIGYDVKQRKVLLKALRDGFNMEKI